MNVLQSLKIKDTTILNIKEDDILVLLVRVNDDCTYKEMDDMQKGIAEILINRGFENVAIWITSNVEDIKIIRR